MFAFSRAFLCGAVQFLAPPAQAQGYPLPYAILVAFYEARQILGCPLCNYPLGSPTYVVRTAEGLNLAFADGTTAVRAAELLNWMARAKNQCARAEYELGFEEYTEMMSLRDEKTVHGWDEGVFGVVNPHRDLSSLAEYVLPPFHNCLTHRVARAKASPDRTDRARLKWSRR
jgi:hypothetical protein